MLGNKVCLWSTYIYRQVVDHPKTWFSRTQSWQYLATHPALYAYMCTLDLQTEVQAGVSTKRELIRKAARLMCSVEESSKIKSELICNFLFIYLFILSTIHEIVPSPLNLRMQETLFPISAATEVCFTCATLSWKQFLSFLNLAN